MTRKITRMNPNKSPVVPFTTDEMRWITFRAMQQAGQAIATCLSNSDVGASDVDYICSFRKGHTARLLIKCLDWDGKWSGPSIRELALIARACGFRLDFELSREPPRMQQQPQPQAPEGVDYIDGNAEPTQPPPGVVWTGENIQERPDQEPIDPKNPPVKL